MRSSSTEYRTVQIDGRYLCVPVKESSNDKKILADEPGEYPMCVLKETASQT